MGSNHTFVCFYFELVRLNLLNGRGISEILKNFLLLLFIYYYFIIIIISVHFMRSRAVEPENGTEGSTSVH